MRILLLSLLSLVAILVAQLPPALQAQPAQPQPAQLGFFGLNTYFTGLERINNDGDDGVAALIGLGRQSGAGWAREELSWGNLERQAKGRWDWKYFDQRLLETARGGYGIIGMLLTTPAWARVADCAARIERYAGFGVRPQDYWCPPANPQDFADYVAAVVERYDGDGLADAPGSPRVAAWQLWNEPNHWETWPGTPAEYAAILRAGYTAAKLADPTAIVATGGVYVFDGAWTDNIGHNDGLRFLDQAFSADPAAWLAFDALAIHPFMPDVAPDAPGLLPRVSYWGRLTTAREWLAARTQLHGGPQRAVWISEVGWSTCSFTQPDCYVGQAAAVAGAAPTPGDWRLAVGASGQPPALEDPQPAAAADRLLIGKSEEQQANYMVRAHAMALAQGVTHLSYFQLEDKFDGSVGNFWEEASIIEPRSSGYRPKAAYNAYRVMVQQLGGVRFIGFGPLNSFVYNPDAARVDEAVYHLRFLSYDNVVVDVLWRNSGAAPVALRLEPGRSAGLVFRDGPFVPMVADAGVVQIMVSEEPVYLRQTLPAELAVDPAGLALLLETGAAPRTYTLQIGNSGSGLVSWNAASTAGWLQVQSAAGQGWATPLTIRVDPTGLTPGVYQAAVSITSDAGARQVPITLQVAPQVWRQWFPLALR